MSKELIYYHRSYRKVTGSSARFAGQFLLTTLPLLFGIFWTYPESTGLMCRLAGGLLAPYFAPEALETIRREFLLENRMVSLLTVPGSYPSSLTSLVTFLVLLVSAGLLLRVKGHKHLAISLLFPIMVHMVSALFFLLAPHHFPYTVATFSDLYVKTSLCIWSFIPFVMATALLPLPAPFAPKYLLIVFTLIYAFVFATLRYALFLYILSKYSFIYMALLYFSFGPLIDFFYVVGIYSVYTARLAGRLKGRESTWRWLY